VSTRGKFLDTFYTKSPIQRTSCPEKNAANSMEEGIREAMPEG